MMKRFSFLLIAVTALMILAQGCERKVNHYVNFGFFSIPGDTCSVSSSDWSGVFVASLGLDFLYDVNGIPFQAEDINRSIMTTAFGEDMIHLWNDSDKEGSLIRYAGYLRDETVSYLENRPRSSFDGETTRREGYYGYVSVSGHLTYLKGGTLSYLIIRRDRNTLEPAGSVVYKPIVFDLARNGWREEPLTLNDVIDGGWNQWTYNALSARLRLHNKDADLLGGFVENTKYNPYENFLFEEQGMRWYLDIPLMNGHYEYTLSWKQLKGMLRKDLFKEKRLTSPNRSAAQAEAPLTAADAVSSPTTATSPSCEAAAEVAVPLDAEIDTDGEITRAAVNRDPRGNFLLEGDFMETGQIKCGLRDAGSYAPIYLHLEYYENVLYLTYSGGDRQELPLSEVKDGGQIRHYAMGSSQYYSYDSRFNKVSIIRGFEVNGQGYWVEVVPAGGGYSGSSASSNGSYNQQQMMQQQQDYQKQQLEQQYRSQYAMWEQTVQNTWNTLTGMVSGAARTSVRMQLRNAQSEMRSVRQNAQIQGIHIMASPWENASIPYGLDD